MSFLEKYKPKTLKDIYGNKVKINKAIEWIKNFDKNEKKLLLLSGPPGVGKTSLAHIILKMKIIIQLNLMQVMLEHRR